MAGPCEHENGHAGFVRGEEFFDQLSYCPPLKQTPLQQLLDKKILYKVIQERV